MQNLTSNLIFQNFFDTADILYRFIERPDFAKLFETNIRFCDYFIEMNLDMVVARKAICLAQKSNRSVSRFMTGRKTQTLLQSF